MGKNPTIVPLNTLIHALQLTLYVVFCDSLKKHKLCHSTIWLKNLLCTRQNVTHCNVQARWSRSEVLLVCLFVLGFFFVFGTGYKEVSLGTVDEVDEKAETSRFTVFNFYLS